MVENIDLLEDMDSILSTHTKAHNGLQLQLQDFSRLHGYQAYSWHKDIYEYKTPMYINKNFKQLKWKNYTMFIVMTGTLLTWTHSSNGSIHDTYTDQDS